MNMLSVLSYISGPLASHRVGYAVILGLKTMRDHQLIMHKIG